MWIPLPKLVMVLAFFISLRCAFAQAQETPQEVVLEISYDPGNVYTTVSALYYANAFYISFDDVCSALHIQSEYDLTLGNAQGFFIREENTFHIDFIHQSAVIGARNDTLFSHELLHTELHWFLHPSAYLRLFGLRFTIDFSRLQLSLETDVTLPIVLAVEREKAFRFFQITQKISQNFPLQYPRERSMLRGGVMDYSLTASRDSRATSYLYDVKAGGEILGGDITAEILGTLKNQQKKISTSNVLWRYVVDSTSSLTQVNIGDIISGGVINSPVQGISISNQPIQPRQSFSTFIIEERTQPLWSVQLLQDEKLISVQTADEVGNVRFTVPLTYGTTNYSVRFYGPNGEVVDQRRRVEIPFTFTPPGELVYGISGGKLLNNAGSNIDAYSEYGISKRLSERIGIQYIRDTISTHNLFYSTSSLRIMDGCLINVDAVLPYRYAFRFSNVHSSQISYNASYTNYANDTVLNVARLKENIQSLFFFPFQVRDLYFTSRAQVSRLRYERSTTDIFNINLSGSLKGTSVSTEYRVSNTSAAHTTLQQSLLGIAALRSLMVPNSWMPAFSGMMVSASYYYNTSERRSENMRAEVSSNIFTGGRISLAFSHDYLSSASQIGLQLIYDFGSTRSTSSLQISQEQQFTQNLNGAIAYDETFNSLNYYSQQWVGRSAVRFIPFVDGNNDGIKQYNEAVLPDETITIREAASFQRRSNGTQEAWQLEQYNRYNAEVMETSSEETMLSPREKYFSFIAEPNYIRAVHVPYLPVGVIEGSVLKVFGSVQTPVSGLKLHVRSEDGSVTDISVFQDGVFYYAGLKLGTYTIEVDAAQLQYLKSIAVPSSRTFTITSTLNNTSVSGLNFELMPINKK